uniref:protein NLRC5-like n=1 Tax=Semicossyphus pulcher TaxID=241346 RepID=UPI0037E98107
MACTAQSALDYVKNARRHLVGELKNLPVIVENLYQQEVFKDEEVSKIQTERDDYDKTRRILDSVTKKGEAACYKFLRIIDMTRRKTSGGISLLPKEKTVTPPGTKKFDLDYWISCYPFKEDPQMYTLCLKGPRACHDYQAELKSRAQKKWNEFWKRNKTLFEKNCRPDLSYTSLVLDTHGSGAPSKIKTFKNKKSKLSRPKKLRTYIPEDRPDISPSDLLKTHKNILLVGKPGTGKTALSHEMLKLWADGDSKELDYMFYFDMRETAHITNAKSLKDLLFSVYSEPDEGKEEVLQDIKKHSDNVTFIFDGLTDRSSSVVQSIVAKDLLPHAKVIITCRADDEEDFLSGDVLRVEVKGFSERTIDRYFSAILGEEKQKVLSNMELLTLCHVPMYALMVAACFLSEAPEAPLKPCSITEIYINIVRFGLQMSSNQTNKYLNSFIKQKREEIMSLAEAAFHATEGKTVNLIDLHCEDSCVLSFLKQLVIKVAPTETKTTYAFLHYTVQEFFAAVWLLRHPEKMKDVFQLCLTEERKHMKHLIPFMCRLLTEKNPTLMELLIPAQELKNTSNWFFKEMISTFSPDVCKNDEADDEDSQLDVDILFLCQCLYESQCPDACVYFLETLDYHLNLSRETLDSYSCCAVAYMVTQSKERKIQLNLEDVVVSEQGVRRLFGCLNNVQWCDPLPQQLWEIVLLREGRMEDVRLPSCDGNQLPLPVQGKRQLYERAVNLMRKVPMKVDVCLHWDNTATPVCQSLCQCLLESFPNIRSLSFRMTCDGPGPQQSQGTLERVKKKLFLDLCLKAALHREDSFHNVVKELLSLFSVNTHRPELLFDFYQHFESEGCSSVIPKLTPFFESTPAVWFINLLERKTSILLEVLKLQSKKKQVELRRCSEEESEVRTFLQCLPYISQLSFYPWSQSGVKFCGNLFCAAAEREQQTGEKILELLSSLCTYQTFPLRSVDGYDDDDDDEYRSSFLLDLYSHMKDCETTTGLRVLPSLQSVFQSTPAVWVINLSERKTSILLEVLKLQSGKKQVELRGCSEEESEVRTFLQCLPYISQLSCGPEFFQRVCTNLSARSREEAEQLVSLLQLLGFSLLLTGEVHSKTCRSVGTVLRLCGSKVDLTLTPRKMSVRGASLLFRHTTQLHSLRLSNNMALFLSTWVRRTRVVCLSVTEELSLASERARPSERVLLRVVSSLASLLRYWRVRRLDLTESWIPVQGLIPLLLHDGPLTIKLSEKMTQQLLALLHDIQDKDLTRSFLSKVNGDLTPLCLDWELLRYLLQQPSLQTLTVNLRENGFLQESITRLLPFVDRIIFKRPCPSFVLTAIREVYTTRASSIIPSLLRSFDHVINLTCREMDSVDCAALLFTLKHSEGVKLNLLWTSIPTEETLSILFTLDNVSRLSVDRNLLLRFVHCCAASDVQQGAADSLLRTLQHRLDLSCSSCVELSEDGQSETLTVSVDDCRALSTILRCSSQDTQLHLQDCEVEDSGLDLLFPVLDRVRLRVSKVVLLQLMSLVPVFSEWVSVRRAVSLCRSLGGELDLSHSKLDQRACRALAEVLDFSEGLTELDLSHCQLTDQLLLTLIPNLHKVKVLDLSHNKITDALTFKFLTLVSIIPSIETVRLFGNNIKDQTLFKGNKQFEIW